MTVLYLETRSSGVSARTPTVSGALEEWLLDRQAFRNLSAASITFYRNHTRRLLAATEPDAPVTEISYEQVRQVLASIRARGCKDNTVHADFRAIRAFIRWCVRQGWQMDVRIVMMDGPLVPDGDRVEIFTPAELDTLHKQVMPSLRDTALYALLLGTGIRLAELVAVKIEDRTGEYLRVMGKGRKERIVPLSSRVLRDWVRYVQRERGTANGPYFPLTRNGVRQVFVRLGRATGIAVHPHKFRHTFATLYCRRQLEERGTVDLERLRLILGHTTYSLIPRYVHLAQSDIVSGWNNTAPY